MVHWHTNHCVISCPGWLINRFSSQLWSIMLEDWEKMKEEITITGFIVCNLSGSILWVNDHYQDCEVQLSEGAPSFADLSEIIIDQRSWMGYAIWQISEEAKDWIMIITCHCDSVTNLLRIFLIMRLREDCHAPCDMSPCQILSMIETSLIWWNQYDKSSGEV